MAAMEGVEFWLRWFLLVSPQSWPRHHPPRRCDLERAKRRRQPGWWILESRGEIRRNLALRSQIVLCPSPCDRHACCLWWISLSCKFLLTDKIYLAYESSLWNHRKRPSGFTENCGQQPVMRDLGVNRHRCLSRRPGKAARPDWPRLLRLKVQRLVVTIAVAKGTHRSRSDPALVAGRKIWANTDQKERVCAGARGGIECPGEIRIALRV